MVLESDTIEVLPKCIFNLKLLRLLGLGTPNIIDMPKSINNLKNLQTFWLEYEKLKNVPNIGSLKKLCCLDIHATSLVKMPWGIILQTLHSVAIFVLGNGHGYRVRELENLNRLQRELKIYGLEKVLKVGDAKQAQLNEKFGLDKLSLKWESCEEQVDDNKTQEDVLEQLKPPTSIKACKLDGYMGLNLPAWLGDPSLTHMVGITLMNLKKCKGLLPHLPRLKTLNIERCREMGFSLSSLPSLVELVVWGCEEIRITSGESCELACLKKLEIKECPNVVFSSAGHLHLPVLEEIKICKCENLENLLSQMLTSTSLQRLEIM